MRQDYTYNGGGGGSVEVDRYCLDVYVDNDDYDLDLATITDENGNNVAWESLSPAIQKAINEEAQAMMAEYES